jgi:uncharacterized membrane protein
VDVSALTAVVSALVAALPRIGLKGSERTLKERIVDNVALPILSANNPVTHVYIPESQISSDRFSFFALGGVYKQWPASAKCTHQTLIPPLILLITFESA